MIFRFRKYDTDDNKYNYVTSMDIEDFEKMYKTLTFMKEHKCLDPIEINTENAVDTLGDYYMVEDVALSVSSEPGDEGLIPIFVVDLV